MLECVVHKQLSDDAEDSAEEESAAAKPPRAGVKRTRAAAKHTGELAGAAFLWRDRLLFV